MISLINASGFAYNQENSYQLFSSHLSFEASIRKPSNPTWATHLAFWRELNGPFACVIQNSLTQEVILVRDHLGVAPLYYCYQAGTLIFGHALPDIVQYLPNTPAVDDKALANLFSHDSTYSDDTLFSGIKRVEPGHLMRITPDGRSKKQTFWSLSSEGEPLLYSNDEEYVEHFTVLMQEAVQRATIHHHHKVAAEFSAGMDSTALYAACATQGIHPDLFMHAAIHGSKEEQGYNDCYEEAILNHFKPKTLYRIRESGFDPLAVFEEYSKWFAGAPAYIFDLFAHNLHQAVAKQGHTLLLSGFGGDRGVSGHASIRFILPELIRQKGLSHTRQLIRAEQKPSSWFLKLKNEWTLLSYTSSNCYHMTQWLKNLRYQLQTFIKHNNNPPQQHPYEGMYFNTLREAEWSLLQGPLSHEIRMRIEASSIVSKQFGFEYRYPLLYPKLLEFYLALPLDQKRRAGKGRFLMRRYLEKQLPKAGFAQYQKKEGLHIVPATMAYFTQQSEKGLYDALFKTLSYPGKKSTCLKTHRLKLIKAFMLKHYLDHLKPRIV